jgi:hypothetical protein
MLVLTPIMMGFMLGCFGIFVAVAAATDGDEAAMTIVAIITVSILVVVGIVMWIVMILLITPFMIRAGLTQDFRASFDIPWVKDFVRKMWKEILLSTVFLMAMAVIVELLGLLAFCVGIYPAVAAVMLMQGHLYLQLYQLYLARGGQKIPLKPSGPLKPNMNA